MNNPIYQHLLSQHGVLIEFNIAKKIKPSYISGLKKKLSNTGKTEDEIQEEINKKIILSTNKFIQEHEIPGLIPPDEKNKYSIPDKIKSAILTLSKYCVTFSKKNKLNKEYILLFVQLLLQSTSITNDDVQKFKDKYGFDSNNNDEYDDDDDN